MKLVSKAESFIAHLHWQLVKNPQRIACYALAYIRGNLTAIPLSLRDLAIGTRAIASSLSTRRFSEGRCVLLAVGHPHKFLLSFLGIIEAGLIPVPLPPLGETHTKRIFLERFRSVSVDCAPIGAIVSMPQSFQQNSLCLNVPTFSPEQLMNEVAQFSGEDYFDDTKIQEAAFIQYTSGSTSKPRGVVVTHRNLLSNCKAIANGCTLKPDDRAVTWLPLYHDMGLVGALLTSIYSETPIYVMPTSLFMARPVSWLRAIQAFKGTISVGPTFAYELCANRIPDRQLDSLDLQSWRVALIGSEPIDAPTLGAFSARFAGYGFQGNALTPVYGLAEATLAVTFSPVDQPYRVDSVCRNRIRAHKFAEPVAATSKNSISFVSVGRAVENHEIWIIDPESEERLPERHIGEVIVRGPSVTPRYFGDTNERTLLKTGDLGYIANGELFICDRIKDLIIIAGQNYFPGDIEKSLASFVMGLRRGRIIAFCGRSLGKEKLNIAAEFYPSASNTIEELEANIRKVVASIHGLPVDKILLLPKGSLLLTSSGKLQRHLTLNLINIIKPK